MAEQCAMQIPWTWIILAAVIVLVLVLKQRGQMSADMARRLLGEGATVIDVRSEQEFSTGHISGAVNLPLDAIAGKIATVSPEKNAPVLLHCLSGTRSAMACGKLRAMGYTQVFNLGSLGRARSLCEAVGRK